MKVTGNCPHSSASSLLPARTDQSSIYITLDNFGSDIGSFPSMISILAGIFQGGSKLLSQFREIDYSLLVPELSENFGI